MLVPVLLQHLHVQNTLPLSGSSTSSAQQQGADFLKDFLAEKNLFYFKRRDDKIIDVEASEVERPWMLRNPGVQSCP